MILDKAFSPSSRQRQSFGRRQLHSNSANRRSCTNRALVPQSSFRFRCCQGLLVLPEPFRRHPQSNCSARPAVLTVLSGPDADHTPRHARSTPDAIKIVRHRDGPCVNRKGASALHDPGPCLDNPRLSPLSLVTHLRRPRAESPFRVPLLISVASKLLQ